MTNITIKDALKKSMQATKQYVDSKATGISYDDLENKPFYSLKDTALLVDTMEVSLWEGAFQPPYFKVVEGEPYTVTLDGNVYTVTAYFDETAKMVAIGNIDATNYNNENPNLDPPFFIYSPNEEETFVHISYDCYSSHTIKIEGTIETVTPLDEKYLPDCVAGKRYPDNSEIFNDYVNNVVWGEYAHAEGHTTNAYAYSHAEGMGTTANGNGAHAEGYYAGAQGQGAHAEGIHTAALDSASHAEGVHSQAEKMGSHAEGYYTVAASQYQHVQGQWNERDAENKYAHIVGNGTGQWTGENYHRSNAHTLDWDGNAWYQGNVSVDGTPTADNDLVTKKYVDNKLAGLQIVQITQSEYDALTTKDANTLYLIVG